jgi:hypothetical protein
LLRVSCQPTPCDAVVFIALSGFRDMLSIFCSTRNLGELGIAAGRVTADADLPVLCFVS